MGSSGGASASGSCCTGCSRTAGVATRHRARPLEAVLRGRDASREFREPLDWFDRYERVTRRANCASRSARRSTRRPDPTDGRCARSCEACVARVQLPPGKPEGDLGWRRDRLIGQTAAAGRTGRGRTPRAGPGDPRRVPAVQGSARRRRRGRRLAHAIFDHPDAKVLLLSATPYKMYTLPDEPEGDDHYRDFTRTVRFLAGDERAHIVERELRAMRECLCSGGDRTPSQRGTGPGGVRAAPGDEPDRATLLDPRPRRHAGRAPARRASNSPPQDLRSWRTFDDVARQIDRHDVFEYWRSTPYPLNLMERNSYQVRTKFQAAVERNDPAVAATARAGARTAGLGRHPALPTDRPRKREDARPVPRRPRSRRMATGLAAAVPSLLRTGRRLRRARAADLHQATDLLGVGRRAEGDRGDAELRGGAPRRGSRRIQRPRVRRPSHHTALAVPDGRRPGRGHAGPCVAVPSDSFSRGRATRWRSRGRSDVALPVSREPLLDAVREPVREASERAARRDPLRIGTPDQRWYWAAPFLLDRGLADGENCASPAHGCARGGRDEEDQESRLGAHLHAAADASRTRPRSAAGRSR